MDQNGKCCTEVIKALSDVDLSNNRESIDQMLRRDIMNLIIPENITYHVKCDMQGNVTSEPIFQYKTKESM